MENLQQMKNSNNNSVSRKRSRKDGQICFVEKDYFKQLLGMIPGFVMPSRRQHNEMMESELQKMQKNLLQLIKDSQVHSKKLGNTGPFDVNGLLLLTDQGSNMLLAVRTVAQEDEFTLQLQRENALEDADEEEEEDRGIDIRYNSDQLKMRGRR
uniref:Uncharacterized protein n=1 Tax=Ditylenchus dipsaci TaxID=166011 RepID=A0A915D7D7_9BILA